MEDRPSFPRPTPGSLSVEGILEGFAHRMMYSVAKDEHTATPLDVYEALAFTVRDRVMERWFATQDSYYRQDVKRVYYLSLEYLTGRFLLNDILNLGVYDAVAEAMRRIGYELSDLLEQEWDPGLGNGGLGRLAACFMDSAATLALPVYGYGLRYEYGIFRQRIRDGYQMEAPDTWLRYGSPWEIPRPDALFPVQFYGKSTSYRDDAGRERWDWTDAETIWAMAYDYPVIGWGSGAVNSLRLWAAKSSREFDLGAFNLGNYVQAVEAKSQTETLTRVLYPSSDRDVGKELRLKQQYFFVSATLQDLLRRFLKKPGRRIEELPEKVAVQLNDTHPSLAIPELMRILLDDRMLSWEAAWDLTVRTFAYTNHTVLPEALETWSMPLFSKLLPRHLAIIEEIDRRLRARAKSHLPKDPAAPAKVALVDPAGDGTVRMANLSIAGSHSTNGVAAIHSRLLITNVFPEMARLFPTRFRNVTNGITPRRWLAQANPRLAALITEAIGDGWRRDLDELRRLAPLAEDAAFRERWAAVKRANKAALAGWLKDHHGMRMDPDAICDVQVKRIHEYKRQLLNVLHVLALWKRLKDGADEAPRTVIFAGKAAPSYVMAKLVIKLIHAVAEAVRSDPAARDRLRVLFVPNYSVSVAERIFPACELSEQISTAGTEASGTGNMKAALNGGITIGTLDGANIEIAEAVGAENVFIFGKTVEEIEALEREGYDTKACVEAEPALAAAVADLAVLDGGAVRGVFRPIVDVLLHFDRYFHAADFRSYVATQARAASVWRAGGFPAMSIRNVAGCGRFSSDRTIRQYADEIWGIVPVPPRGP